MRARFIAFASDHVDPGAAMIRDVARRNDLSVFFESERLIVFANLAAGPALFADGRGLVVGPLFRGLQDSQPIRVLPHNEGAAIERSAGRHLIANYWGAYVALWLASNDDVQALRDPSGAIPCYYAQIDRGLVIASDAEMLCSALDRPPEVDWAYIAYHLRLHDLKTPRTGLSGVSELLCGHRLSWSPKNSTVSMAWSPWDHIALDEHLSEVELAERLRVVTLHSIKAVSSCFNNVVLGVSGGLDSSIVARGVAEGTAKLSCFTMVTRDPAGDERRYARKITDALGVPLHEVRYQLADTSIEASDAFHLPRPSGLPYAQPMIKAWGEIGETYGGDGFFSGAGGDSVFCIMGSVTPIVDTILAGLPPGKVAGTVRDVARLTGCSLWTGATRGLARAIKGHRYRWAQDCLFLPQVENDAKILPRHPWLDDSAASLALPGKLVHVAYLLKPQNFAEFRLGGVDGLMTTPLLAQPIVEACLAIPSWKWVRGGHNRVVARDAFARELPKDIVRRRSKGGPESYCVELFDANRTLLLHRLCEGMLAARGLLDVDVISNVLRSDRPVRGSDHLRLLELSDVETWVRHWSTRGAKVAQAA